MGSPISQVAPSTQPQGKGGFQAPRPQQDFNQGMAMPQGLLAQLGRQNAVSDYSAVPFNDAMPSMPNQSMMMSPAVQPTGQFETRQGKGGSVTLPGQGGQPRMGQPNMYPNTVGQWDNASIQPQQSRNRGGKGKG